MFNNKKTQRHKNGFTLVELIVVIVILAILATIAFLSFSSQSASARDSTRLSDMSNIAKGLSVFNATAGSYPKPDSNITLNVSGNPLSYQGKAGNTVLNLLNISSGGGRDPLDKSSFYTYSTNASQSKYQILGFLEDGSNNALSIVPRSFASDYSKRFIITRGDGIGILLSSGTLDPVENQLTTAFTGIDIASTPYSYTMKFDKDTSIIGTGSILKSGIISTKGLVGYWNFDEGSGNIAFDKSGNSNNGTLSGNSNPSWSGGKVGGGLDFSSGFINIPYTNSLNITESISFVFWINTRAISAYGNIISKGDPPLHSSQAPWQLIISTSNKLDVYRLKNDNYTAMAGTADLPIGIWSMVAVTYDKSLGKVKIYKNGVISSEFIKTNQIYSDDTAVTIGAQIWNGTKTGFLNALLDEVRIYNIPLSAGEIQTLYISTK